MGLATEWSQLDWLLYNSAREFNRAIPSNQRTEAIDEENLFLTTFIYYQRLINGRCLQSSK